MEYGIYFGFILLIAGIALVRLHKNRWGASLMMAGSGILLLIAIGQRIAAHFSK